MGQKQTIRADKSYFMTMTVVGWIDVFTRESHRKVVIDSLRYSIEHKGLNLFAYCIMSNHIHLIANTEDGHLLKDTMRDLKKFIAKKVIADIEEKPESRKEWMLELFRGSAEESKRHQAYRFWQTGNHAIELQTADFTWNKVRYIHNNPVEAGWVAAPEHWIYSSAGNYMEQDDVLIPEVHCLIPPLTRF